MSVFFRKINALCAIVITLSVAVHAQVAFIDPARLVNMAYIPGATFEIGTDEADIPGLMQKFGVRRAELFLEESPRHRVTIGAFYLDRTEVTNAQFKTFVDSNPSWHKDKAASELHNGKYLQHWNGSDIPVGAEDLPVTFVSWFAAAAFCHSQGKRLPTEAEWEYAARGGIDGKTFPWGDEMPDKMRANYGASDIKRPVKVGSYPANGYGLHDMAGNVWEFLADEWQKYPAKARVDTPGKATSADIKTRRALRGGSFGGGVVNLRVGYRDSHLPENAAEHVGFRCAMTPPVQSDAINELLRLHYADRAAHFNRDAAYIFSQMADDYVSVGGGRIRKGDPAAGLKRMQAYFDASTFIEWDDITPPVIRVSDDRSMATSIVHKRVRLRAKDAAGVDREEIEVFAWTATFRRVNGMWKLTSITSTNTPEADK